MLTREHVEAIAENPIINGSGYFYQLATDWLDMDDALRSGIDLAALHELTGAKHAEKDRAHHQRHDEHKAALERRINEGLREVAGLRAAVQKHAEQKADDRCWMDDIELYEAFGLKHDSRVGSKPEMLRNCERFIHQRCSGGGPWKSYHELELEVAGLRARLAALECSTRRGEE